MMSECPSPIIFQDQISFWKYFLSSKTLHKHLQIIKHTEEGEKEKAYLLFRYLA
jgi:hypothetical protein